MYWPVAVDGAPPAEVPTTARLSAVNAAAANAAPMIFFNRTSPGLLETDRHWHPGPTYRAPTYRRHPSP